MITSGTTVKAGINSLLLYIEHEGAHRMETRIERKQSSVMIKIVIISMVFIFISLFGLPIIQNDTTVYHDIDTESTLKRVGQPNVEINWSESKFQDVMHKMTHQKVIARKKIGAIETNDTNIAAMVEIAEFSSYEHREYYLDILMKWAVGDFSGIDNVHNKLRKLQGEAEQDTRAYGGASKKAEQKFIQKVFKD